MPHQPRSAQIPKYFQRSEDRQVEQKIPTEARLKLMIRTLTTQGKTVSRREESTLPQRWHEKLDIPTPFLTRASLSVLSTEPPRQDLQYQYGP
jgi:hypothetical protein